MKLSTLCAGLFLFGALAGCSGDGGAGSSTCASFCGTLSDCGYSLTSGDCSSECASQLAEASSISGACRDAAEAEAQCVGALSCEDLELWLEEPPDYPCSAEEAATDVACNS